jgi:aromatic-L-amino-acid/L-tryptophan decarboxylase
MEMYRYNDVEAEPRTIPAAGRETSRPFEETLDPADWESFRREAHRVLDVMIDWQRDVRQRPAWQPVPDQVERRFLEGAPHRGVGLAAAIADFETMVLPYPTGLPHPRFWGWAGGNGSPTGMLADLMASGMNAIPGNFNDAASRVEAQALDWMKEALSYPRDAGGIVLSGGSVANLTALAVARDSKAEHDVREHGVAGSEGRLAIYASTEVHSCVFKAAQLLGLGRRAVRLIPVDRAYRIRVPELVARIEKDRREGLRPFAVVGTAGTINTGSIDDLEALAAVAAAHNLWFHVDGAFGAIAALSPETRNLVRGMCRADSIAFDFHKWMYVNYEAGCLLVRDANALRHTFASGGDYLKPLPRGTGAWHDPAAGRGPQLSRAFKALKVWMTLKEHGLEKFGRLVAQNVAQARYLASRIDASAALQRVAPVGLNVVAFRGRFPGEAGEAADELNRELLMRIQESGVAVPSGTVLEGRYVLRACICNHRTRREDLDAFVDAAAAQARALEGRSS